MDHRFSKNGLSVLLTLLSFSALGQTSKAFQPFGWGAYSRSFHHVFCGLHNQAALAGITHFTAGVLAERHFMLEATSSYTFAIAVPTSSGTFCLQGNHFGYEKFNRQQLGLAYGRHLWEWLDVGMQLDYLNMHIPRYGAANAFTFEAAMLIHWNEHWHTGLQVFNPVHVTYHGLGNDAIPATYRLGIGYQPSEILMLSAEISSVDHFPVAVALAFHYHIVKSLGLMGGVSTGEEKLFLGMTLYLNKFQILFTGTYHSRLGISPGAGVIYMK